jgi:FtsH-binding integral membrane protein
MNSESFRKTFGSTAAIIILSVGLMVFSIVIGCCQDFTRKYGLPILIIFTIIFALLVGVICSASNPQVVTTAAGITALVVIALTIFSCNFSILYDRCNKK